jgi:predicted nucleotidyltransferase
MQQNKTSLVKALQNRLRRVGPPTQEYVAEASEVIVFGSMSIGLQRQDSDMDVLCIGSSNFKLKSELIDLIVVSAEATKSQAWLQSELASHVATYGIWLRGVPEWTADVHIGGTAVSEKCRRIETFIMALQRSWLRLHECFRVKYSVKLRRETQRLILLERGVSIPPTRILDFAGGTLAGSHDVCDRLREFSSEAFCSFNDDLLSRVSAHFRFGGF